MPDLQDQQSDQNHKYIHQPRVRVGRRISFHRIGLIRPIDDRIVERAITRVIAVAVESTGSLVASLSNYSEWSGSQRSFVSVR